MTDRWLAGLTALTACLLLSACEIPELYVDAGHTGPEAGTMDRPFRSIDKAMRWSVSGTTIHVAPGRYRENVVLKEGVHLLSRQTGAAIIDGGANRAARAPAVEMAVDSILEGFTVTGGETGVLCKGPVSADIRRNIIRGNRGDGGIAALAGCTARIHNNTILGNLGKTDRHHSQGIHVELSTPDIRNNIIVDNSMGLSTDRSRPTGGYNLFWGNRLNYGFSSTLLPFSLEHAPGFVDTAMDDYRLEATSAARDAGDPSSRFADLDGSRNDIGAMHGDGGYDFPLPMQETFVESALGAHDREDGLYLRGTSRLMRSPTFWFETSARGTQGEADAMALLREMVPRLLPGFRANFRTTVPTADERCQLIVVSFTSPRGIPYRALPDGSCSGNAQDAEKQGARISGGLLDLSSQWLGGFADNRSAITTMEHELGHVLGLAHSFAGDRLMGQPFPDDGGMTEQERLALRWTHSGPPGQTFEDFIRYGRVTRNVLHPFPRIEEVWRWVPQEGFWRSARRDEQGLPPRSEYWARPGDWILVVGSRLSLRWMTEPRLVFRPADHALPKVQFSGQVVTVRTDDQACRNPGSCAPDEPANTWAGQPARFMKVQVPEGARSGWFFVESRGLASNPVWIDIESG
ncbi:DUF1565 domain-containing protein [Hydrogenophaga sp. 5NK40-0174]|uniref:DUF1565 domain-containing protein n=1 Tax=Hydrogenophaga sp. 5NK40-0174 TaxID=3127649 RepID=UPI003103EFD3